MNEQTQPLSSTMFTSQGPPIDHPSNSSQSISDTAWQNVNFQDVENPGEESDASGGSDAEEQQNEQTKPESKKPRTAKACLTCRRMKTRCEPSVDGGPCKLCLKYNRECVMSPPRRPRKKTVQRVSELERKINALTAALEAKESKDSPGIPTGTESSDATSSNPAPMPEKQLNQNSAPSFLAQNEFLPASVALDPRDIIDKGYIDQDSAYRAFERYTSHSCHYSPFVMFPPTTTPEDLRRQKPTLFTAIVLAGLGNMADPRISHELVYDFAVRVVYRGERSLELCQSLLVYINFYSKPAQKKELNFNQMIHIACTMALDIGLGRRPNKYFKSDKDTTDVGSLDARRAWLGCYYFSSNAGISLRNPLFIRWSAYIEECLEVLESRPDATQDDFWLCDLIRIQHIAEEVLYVFSMDDPASVVSLKDAKVQYQLSAFERQLEQWRKNAKVDTTQPYVRFIEACLNIYTHEIALHSEHNIDEFRSPPEIDDVSLAFGDMSMGPARVDSLMTCLESAHAAFDSLLSMDIASLQALPNLFFVRAGYCAIAFHKVAFIFQSQPRSPGRKLAIDIKFDYYMDAMIDLLTQVGQGGMCAIALGFGFVLRKIKQMHKIALAKIEDPTGELARQSGNYDFSCPEAKAIAESMIGGPEAAKAAESYIPNDAVTFDLQADPSVGAMQIADAMMYDIGTYQFFDQEFDYTNVSLYNNNPEIPWNV